MNAIWTEHFEYSLFAAGMLLLFGGVHRWVWRGRKNGAVPLLIWLLVLTVLGSGWFFSESAARREREGMQRMVDGYAPTYARELGRMGHQEITAKTSPEDARYWQLLAAEKRWMEANPAISNIYTLRKLRDGSIAFIVDSESDYDHNGVYDGAAEQRTKIGKTYDGAIQRAVESALAGKRVFVNEPYTDSRGTWVTALVPIRNFRGDVEAAVGVDFDAGPWVAATQRARVTTIGCTGAFLLLVACGCWLLARQNATRHLQMQLRDQEGTITEKQKLETLVNSIDGIVWEAEARTFAFNFVSQQCERIVGYSQADWMTGKDFWKTKLHPEDLWAWDHRARMVAGKVPYAYEYRMIAADGRTVWIRESSAVMLDGAGAPLLVRGVFYDITAQKHAAEELEQANARLVDSSRFAGMAEVATGVLHNVGNVLNSVNISGSVISDRLRKSKVNELGKVAGLLTLQSADFIGFVTRDPRGPHIPELISCVTQAIRAEHGDLLEEVESITRNIGHIKEIVSMQQGFAKGAGIVEALSIQAVVDDAIKINSLQMSRHQVSVVQAYEEVPRVEADKHLVLQILVNLLRNAQQAIEESGRPERRIVVKIQAHGDGSIRVAVQDTGGGIAAENLTRIFSHGFTTKKTGHGFGLHSSALAATGMGGALSAHSDGPGTGATFFLDLPVFNPAPTAVAA